MSVPVDLFRWESASCAFCNQPRSVGRAWVMALGATRQDAPQRFLLDLPARCSDCFAKLGLKRRNYSVPGAEFDGGIVPAIQSFLPEARRKVEAHWNYRAECGALDPVTFEPIQPRTDQGP